MKELRVIELFAGVGGFRVGLERADADFFKVVWANQWEPATKTQHAAMVYEKNYGTMDYDSAGRSVDDFVVTLYRCRKCGQLKKEGRGDFCGDPHELTDITEEDYKIAGT